MKKYIFDTDIGADCDDVVALRYLLGKQNDGECEIKAITLCTARKYAPAATFALIDECDCGDIPIGEYKGAPLPCDAVDNYAEVIAGGKTYATQDGVKTQNAVKTQNDTKTYDAVKLMRKTLAENDKIDIICVGPSCNIAGLMDSRLDEFSGKSGVELVKEKVGKLYIMGGAFEFGAGEKPFAEWNVEQDIPSAKKTFGDFPCEVIIVPSEVGARVATFAGSTRGLTRKAMETFFGSADRQNGLKHEENPERTRPSWDPLTCMVALEEDKYNYSENGEVIVSDSGLTEFKKSVSKRGESDKNESKKCRYMSINNDFLKIEKELNDYLKTL